MIRPLGALLLAVGASCAGARPAAPARPHFVLFLADDLAWRDTGAYGSRTAKTPHLDRLASEGMRFTHAFAASPSCAPSRSALYTGLYPARNGAHPNHSAVRPGTRSLPHYLAPLGYRVVLAGKTHVKPPECFPFELVKASLPSRELDLAAIDRVVAEHAGGARGPLCLVVGCMDPHVPWPENEGYDPAAVDLPPRSVDTPETRAARARCFTGVTRMDRQLGGLLESLRRHGLDGNTLLFASADQGIQWPFAKWNLYDAGIRVPLVARWPGRVRAGSTTDALVSLIDLLPTMVEAAGGTPPEGIDGESFLPVLLGQKDVHRDAVFAHHTADGKMNDYPARCIRTATHKLILNLKPESTYTSHITNHIATSGRDYWDSWVKRAETDPAAAEIVRAYQHRPPDELYDLKLDLYETHNLLKVGQGREHARMLRRRLEQWMEDQSDEGLRR